MEDVFLVVAAAVGWRLCNCLRPICRSRCSQCNWHSCCDAVSSIAAVAAVAVVLYLVLLLWMGREGVRQ